VVVYIDTLCEDIPKPTPRLQSQARRRADLATLKLPRAYQITSGRINDISHARRIGKRREQQLRRTKNKRVRDALQAVTKKEEAMSNALTMDGIDQAQRRNRALKDVLRNFEQSPRRAKDRHHLELRTKRAWTKIGSAERERLVQHFQSECKLRIHFFF